MRKLNYILLLCALSTGCFASTLWQCIPTSMIMFGQVEGTYCYLMTLPVFGGWLSYKWYEF